MNLEKFTDRARSMVQAAQTQALRAGHQRIVPEHLLKALLEDEQGLATNLIKAAGGDPQAAKTGTDAALAKLPKVSGARHPDLHRPIARAPARRGPADRREGGRRLRLGRAAPDGGRHGQGHRGREDPRFRRRPPADAEQRDQRFAQGPHRRHGQRRGGLRGAEALCARPDPGGARRQDRPGHRPRRGDPPLHPGAQPPDQEQPRADRRARRRQDRHRRGAGDPHRQRRCPRKPQGQAADGARHGRADRRREVSRRVRGAAEGGAERGHGRGRPRHPVHRRDAHAGRRRQGRGRHGRLEPAQARAGARRAALRRRHHARRVPQACREGRGAGPALPAGLHLRADGAGHHQHPARHQGEVRGAPRRAHRRLRRWSPRRPSRTATSPTASCPTRRST